MKHASIVIRWTLAGLTLFAPGAASAEELGRCYSAHVASAVVLPDGLERAPGQVRVCTSAFHTPVTSLHKVYWNGALVGLFPAQRHELESDALGAARTVLMFSRLRDADRLVLDGYATVEGSRARTYGLTARGRVTSSWQVALAGEPFAKGSEWVLVATNIR